MDWGKNFKPNIRYFLAILRFVAIYTLFGRLWARKFFFGQKQCFRGKSALLCGVYYTESNLQICNYTQKQRIVAKIANTRLTNIFVTIFAFAERLPNSATLVRGGLLHQQHIAMLYFSVLWMLKCSIWWRTFIYGGRLLRPLLRPAPPLLAGLHLALILLTSLHQTLPSSNFQLTNFRFF